MMKTELALSQVSQWEELEMCFRYIPAQSGFLFVCLFNFFLQKISVNRLLLTGFFVWKTYYVFAIRSIKCVVSFAEHLLFFFLFLTFTKATYPLPPPSSTSGVQPMKIVPPSVWWIRPAWWRGRRCVCLNYCVCSALGVYQYPDTGVHRGCWKMITSRKEVTHTRAIDRSCTHFKACREHSNGNV